MSSLFLSSIADALENTASISTPANRTIAGYWKRIAVAIEAIAGASTEANDSLFGYMKRAAVAVEALEGTSGTEENLTEAGYIKRIVDALETSVGIGTGSLINRFNTAAASYTGTPPTEVPSNTSLPVISGAPTEGQTLTVSDGTWTNGPSTKAYQWEADAVAISGETSIELQLTEDHIGAEITCTVTATNVIGAATATSAAVGPVANDPTNDEPGDTWLLADGTWNDSGIWDDSAVWEDA